MLCIKAIKFNVNGAAFGGKVGKEGEGGGGGNGERGVEYLLIWNIT